MSLISFRNWVDADATVITPTYGGSTWAVDPAMPINNLKRRQLSRVCRELNGGDYLLTTDLSVTRRINLIALLGLRSRAYEPEGGSNGYTITVQVATDSGFTTLVYNPGSSSSLLWAPRGAPSNIYLQVPEAIQGRYVRVRTSWSQPVGEAFRDAGRLWIGDAINLPSSVDAGVDVGYSMSVVDPGQLDTSIGGQVYETRRPRARRMTASLYANDVTALGFEMSAAAYSGKAALAAMIEEVGATGELIFLPNTSTPLMMQATGIYGHLDRVPELQRVAGRNYRMTMSIVQER